MSKREIKLLPFHPLADKFPRMEGKELNDLVGDIRWNGQRQPIDVYEGKIIDGITRALVCYRLGIEPKYNVIPAGAFSKPGSLEAYIASQNIHRRHLTAEQKRKIIAELLKANPEKSDRQHAKTAKVSPTHMGKVRKQLEKSGEVSTVDTRTDAKGVKQPAGKPAKPSHSPGPAPKPAAPATEPEAPADSPLDYFDRMFEYLARLDAKHSNLATLHAEHLLSRGGSAFEEVRQVAQYLSQVVAILISKQPVEFEDADPPSGEPSTAPEPADEVSSASPMQACGDDDDGLDIPESLRREPEVATGKDDDFESLSTIVHEVLSEPAERKA
jgi:hypothetical protein